MSEKKPDDISPEKKPRKKYTAEDIKNFKLPEFKITPSLILSLLMIAVIIGISFSAVSKNTAYRKGIAETDEKIAVLNGQIASVESENAKIITPEAARENLSSASQAGNAVAEGQNAYKNIQLSYFGTDKLYDAVRANAESIDKYFDTNDKDGRTQWFDLTTADAVWTFNTNYSFSGNEIPVLWTCYDKSGDLMAYCTAKYNALSGLFKDVKWRTTLMGNAKMPYTPAYDPVYVPEDTPTTEFDIEKALENLKDIPQETTIPTFENVPGNTEQPVNTVPVPEPAGGQ